MIFKKIIIIFITTAYRRKISESERSPYFATCGMFARSAYCKAATYEVIQFVPYVGPLTQNCLTAVVRATERVCACPFI